MPCSCGSPSGLFITLSASELAEMRANALAAITSGRRVSLSGGAKSGTKAFDMDPQQMLMEVNYAMRKLGLVTQRVTKTYGEFVGQVPFPLVANEQV